MLNFKSASGARDDAGPLLFEDGRSDWPEFGVENNGEVDGNGLGYKRMASSWNSFNIASGEETIADENRKLIPMHRTIYAEITGQR